MNLFLNLSLFPSMHRFSFGEVLDLCFHPGKTISRWWFQILFIFTPKIGEDEPMLTHIFQLG